MTYNSIRRLLIIAMLLMGTLTLVFNIHPVTAESIELYYDDGHVDWLYATDADLPWGEGAKFDHPQLGTKYLVQSAKIYTGTPTNPLRLFVFLYNTSAGVYEKVYEQETSTLTHGWNVVSLPTNIVTDQDFIIGVNWVVDGTPFLGHDDDTACHTGEFATSTETISGLTSHQSTYNAMIRAYVTPLPSPRVGGVWVSVDKFGLLAPYIGLISTILVATAATAIYVKRVKRRKKNQ